MTTIGYIVLAIIIFLDCYVIFSLGRIFENTIMIRELEEKIDKQTFKIEMIKKALKNYTEFLGSDDNAEEKE